MAKKLKPKTVFHPGTAIEIKSMYSTTEVAEIVGVTDSLISRYCRKGFQKRKVGVKVGRNYVVSHEDMQLIRDSERTVGRPKTVAE